MLIGKNATWAYLVARTKVMKRKLIPKDEYRKLLNMEFNEIVRYLEETDYKKEIDEFGYRYSGPKLMDYALSLNLSRTYQKIIRISFGLAKDLISSYLKKWELTNIISILRGKSANIPPDEIEEAIVPVERDFDYYKSLIAKDVDEIVGTYRGTPYFETLSKIGTMPPNQIEDELFKTYYLELTKLKPAELSLKLFVDFVKMEVDLRNLKTILRMKVENATPDEIISRLIPNGYELTIDECRKLATMSWSELVKALEGYWFWKGVEKIEEELSTTEVLFDKAWIETIAKRATSYPLSILPVMHYMVLKKVEVDNLRILGWGKWYNMPNEEIEKQMVIV
ncbi:ATP synthase A1 subunit C [Archaeoglobales archaeon]|nr:MAG: ATP synthase A1 subunit C [Archaeoglobales archaeon]